MKYTIKELRARKNETQAQVAMAVGVSTTTYNSWEKSLFNIPIGKVAALAAHFGVTLDDIFIA
nr:helix-turn-helix domain-containing protein [Prevotella denticola]